MRWGVCKHIPISFGLDLEFIADLTGEMAKAAAGPQSALNAPLVEHSARTPWKGAAGHKPLTHTGNVALKGVVGVKLRDNALPFDGKNAKWNLWYAHAKDVATTCDLFAHLFEVMIDVV